MLLDLLKVSVYDACKFFLIKNFNLSIIFFLFSGHSL